MILLDFNTYFPYTTELWDPMIPVACEVTGGRQKMSLKRGMPKGYRVWRIFIAILKFFILPIICSMIAVAYYSKRSEIIAGISEFTARYVAFLRNYWLSLLLLLSTLILLVHDIWTKVKLSKANKKLSNTERLLWKNFHRIARSLGSGGASSELKNLMTLSETLDRMFLWEPVHGEHEIRCGDTKDKPKTLTEFKISLFAVTNVQYKVFIDITEHEPPEEWIDRSYPQGKSKHPVVYVSRKDAESYCKWLSRITGETYRLPKEEEWEAAARGRDKRDFPWKKQKFSRRKCNSAESGIGDTTPVDKYENGKSAYNCYDMVGNVSEWTGTDAEEDSAVVRGSSYEHGPRISNCHFRDTIPVEPGRKDVGFRIAKE